MNLSYLSLTRRGSALFHHADFDIYRNFEKLRHLNGMLTWVHYLT